MNKDYFQAWDGSFKYTNETDREIPEGGTWLDKKFIHYGYFNRVVNFLTGEGFDMKPDMEVDECIRKNYRVGRYGGLQINGHRFPNGFEFAFKEYRDDGSFAYHSNEFSYLVGLRARLTLKKITEFVSGLGDFDDRTRFFPKKSEEWIKCRYAEEWHHEQTDTDFDLHDLDGKETEYPYNGRDREGKTIRNGDIKYFRYYDGYLYRGRVYHNINNMWWVIVNQYEFHNVASFELFDLTPEEPRGRIKEARVPAEYAARRKALDGSKTKELVAELRRRGVKVSYC